MASPVAELDARFATCVRERVEPRWPLRLPGGGMDGVARRRGGILERLLHLGDTPVVVRAAQPAGGDIVLGAWADDHDIAQEAVTRMRRALGLDDDLAAFVERYRWDPLIGASVRRRPHLRVRGRPVAFEALAWAICEQLIEFTRATAIERRIVWRLGRHDAPTGLRDLPSAATLAGTAPAQLCAFGLAEKRALALIRCARQVASGRVDLDDPDHEAGWARLRAIPEIGQWTIDVLASQGQGRLDCFPAGDLGFLKLVGQLRSGGDPDAYATEDEVRELFAPYGAWAGLAATHALGLSASVDQGAASPSPRPSPGRNSLVNARAPGVVEPISSSSTIQVV
ncbi:MAG: DNA-3-methyladenine glycosylase 2 family protein [Solirubrobacteraceae bacterium]|nr:DNA-3-methyladenine glycosylase 2 family protein [Solirubrobacteraceae bacterium]